MNDLITKLEANYIGLALMEDKQAYEDRKQLALSKVKEMTAVDGLVCTKFLHEFVEFFNDGHLFVINQPKYEEEKLAEVEALRTKRSIDVQQALTNLTQNPNSDQLIGRWTDGRSQFLILEDGKNYAAYMIASSDANSEIGLLKMELQRRENDFVATYYTKKHQPLFKWGNCYKDGTLLRLSGGVAWSKMEEGKIFQPKGVKLPTIQAIDNENTLFTIPSFSALSYKDFRAFIKDHDKLLKNTQNLIIDIRGNTGGNAVYFTFIDLYASKNKESSQGLVLASEDTQYYFERFAKNSPKIYQPLVDRIKANMGEVVDGPLYPKRKYKRPKSKIENVAILTDKGCMSASESFILLSREVSDLVTVFGQPTRGVIDYTSVFMVKLKSSGEHNLLFGFPTGTLHKRIPKDGYNEKGIQPDVFLESSVEDKVRFVIDYYK
ncbi:MAG: S41 family peptidase [Bacteroidota bacterium]